MRETHVLKFEIVFQIKRFLWLSSFVVFWDATRRPPNSESWVYPDGKYIGECLPPYFPEEPLKPNSKSHFEYYRKTFLIVRIEVVSPRLGWRQQFLRQMWRRPNVSKVYKRTPLFKSAAAFRCHQCKSRRNAKPIGVNFDRRRGRAWVNRHDSIIE